MTILLLAVLSAAEAAFLIAELPRSTEKAEWSRKRLLVDLTELAAFTLLLLLPDLDLSFRFLGLVLVLSGRLLLAAAGCLIRRKSRDPKRRSGKILSLLLSVILFAAALTPAFLFRSYPELPLTGPYTPATCTAILTDASRTEQFEQDGSAREIPVHLYFPAASDTIPDHSLPLVVFSHGAFGWYQSNLSAYQELASNGYVVASIEHPYHSLFTHDTSGRLITADRQFLKDALTIGSSEAADTDREEIYQTEREWIGLRVADMDFAVDTLKAAAEKQDLSAWTFTEGDAEQFETAARLICPDRIGLMGHSMGGAAAVTVGRRDDIAAVIDIDGTMLGEQTGFVNGSYVINEEPYTTPLLVIDNEESHREILALRQTDYVYANNVVLDHAEQAYNTYFAGTGHMNYTDLPLISPFFANMLGTGEIDPEQCTETLNKLILAFFDHYLKDQGGCSIQEQY